MKTYLQAFDLWEIVNVGIEPPMLRPNPTLAQMRQHNEECAKKTQGDVLPTKQCFRHDLYKNHGL
ncbi:Integrase, catalytic core [Gossypium australe]|uniref:Integrase, catalytic core n=1 Tax=Gossypium australe TaxID=47621 RepID=A0A5B6WIY7_9ROSI|nr:Integrase, catalytic core [Gossypium australe]